jgi:tetratricopeptide (TPR) repeat protein
LRQLYQNNEASENNVSRYLQIIEPDELESLANINSPYQLWLINFLLGKGEMRLAHIAIENASYRKSWKLSRHAETSLALKEFDETDECYFCGALNIGTIGELVKQQPDKTQQLVGNDWFLMSREYGEWLDVKKEINADKFLPAMTENLPKNAGEQAKLGEYYLAKNNLEKAREHLQISLELNEEDVRVLAKLGESFWQSGERKLAEEVFEKVLHKDIYVFSEMMQKLGLQRQARDKIFPILAEKIKQDEDIEAFIYPIARGFDSETEKDQFFEKLATTKAVLYHLIKNELISAEFRQVFYERLLSQTDFDSNDYEFEEISRRTFSNEAAEEVYDHEKDFAESSRERNDKFTFQFDYLEFLLKRGENAVAKKLVLQIENEMKRKIPRPFSLRLKHFQLFGGNLQKIVGIEVTDNVKDVKPPSIERLNEAVTLLRELKRETEADKLTLDFYVRMLELGQNDTANFVGSARQYFKLGDNEKALQTLQKMIDFNGVDTLKNAAEICAEFNQSEKAIEFRRRITEISPNDFENKFELTKLLPQNEAAELLLNLVTERSIPRSLRWKARMKLYEFGEIQEIPNNIFDAYSQFYNGVLLGDLNCLVNSLIADNALETPQLQQLMKVYATQGKPFAAFKLAELDKNPKDDELLDLLSKAAEKIGEFQKAIEFEKAESKVNDERVRALQALENIKNKRITGFTVDEQNVGSLLASHV